jgi:hypothetical protein
LALHVVCLLVNYTTGAADITICEHRFCIELGSRLKTQISDPTGKEEGQ